MATKINSLLSSFSSPFCRVCLVPFFLSPKPRGGEAKQKDRRHKKGGRIASPIGKREDSHTDTQEYKRAGTKKRLCVYAGGSGRRRRRDDKVGRYKHTDGAAGSGEGKSQMGRANTCFSPLLRTLFIFATFLGTPLRVEGLF